MPLLAILIGAYDWRLAFVALGLGTLAIMLCIWLWFPRKAVTLAADDGPTEPASSLAHDLKRILRLPAFQILFWSYFICGYTTSGVIETHFLPYASFCGFGPVPSATAYGLLSAINLVGMILAGWLTDRVNRPLLLSAIYFIRGLTFIILLNVGAEFETLLFFAVLFGLVDYSTVPVTASLVASHIGMHVMGLAFGLLSAGHQVGAALGAYFGGVLYDLYQQYEWVWWSSVYLAVFAGALVLLLRENERPGESLGGPDDGSKSLNVPDGAPWLTSPIGKTRRPHLDWIGATPSLNSSSNRFGVDEPMRVIVLGVGVIGVCTAYYLAKHGVEVAVLNRQASPGLETSFANAGELSYGMTSPWAAPGVPKKALKWLFMKYRPLFIWPMVSPAM